MRSSYITVRYYADDNGTRCKIVSDDRSKEYDVFSYKDGEWDYEITAKKFKYAYLLVKEFLENG